MRNKLTLKANWDRERERQVCEDGCSSCMAVNVFICTVWCKSTFRQGPGGELWKEAHDLPRNASYGEVRERERMRKLRDNFHLHAIDLPEVMAHIHYIVTQVILPDTCIVSKSNTSWYDQLHIDELFDLESHEADLLTRSLCFACFIFAVNRCYWYWWQVTQ